MPHVLQRDGVRICAFNKSAHTSIVNAFCTDAGQAINRGSNTGANEKVLRGRGKNRLAWPEPDHTYVFIRHPLARTVSAWNHLNQANETPVYGRFRKLGFVPGCPFPEFVAHLTTFFPNDIEDEHLRPQTLQAAEALPNCPPPTVVRTEQLDIEWPRMVQRTGLTCTTEIPHFNSHETLEAFDRDYTMATQLIGFYNADYLAWCNRSCRV
jgi:hypothetical protein